MSRADDGDTTKPMVLAIILVSYLMIVLDLSVVITALPRIHEALNFSSTGLSWVQSAYALTFGGLLMLGARAGDILGRRRVFVAGIALFSATSLLGGLAQSSAWLIAARALQGIGAAIAAPSALSLLTVTFHEGRERTRALAYYSAVAGGGGSIGLLLGGMLTQWVSWRWGLFINVPVGALLIWLGRRYLPETEARPGHFDLMGAITSTLGMSSLVYGFVRAGSNGWGDPGTAIAFATGLTLLAAFVRTEMTAQQPITPLRLFASRERTGAYVTRLFVVGAMFSSFFFLTQFLQGVRGYGALHAGLAFLPLTLTLFAMTQIVPTLVPRFGNRRLLTAGLTIAAAGMAWLSRLDPGTPYFPGLLLPMLLLGLGIGLAFGPLTGAGIAGVEDRDAGAASGLVNVAQQLGASLGIGVLTAVFAAASRAAAHHPSAGATPKAEAGHQLAQAVAASLTGSAVLLTLALAVVILVMGRPVAALGRVRALLATAD
jgi:EmrB/QacA subfamily drug resistance transporter